MEIPEFENFTGPALWTLKPPLWRRAVYELRWRLAIVLPRAWREFRRCPSLQIMALISLGYTGLICHRIYTDWQQQQPPVVVADEAMLARIAYLPPPPLAEDNDIVVIDMTPFAEPSADFAPDAPKRQTTRTSLRRKRSRARTPRASSINREHPSAHALPLAGAARRVPKV